MSISTTISDDNSNLNTSLIRRESKSYLGKVSEKLSNSGEKIKRWANGFYRSVIEPCSSGLKGCCASEEEREHRRYIKEATKESPYYRYVQGNILKNYSNYEYHVKNENSTTAHSLDESFIALEKLGLLEDWMKLKKYPDLETAKKAQQQIMRNGLCVGYSTALIDLMSKFGNLGSQELIDKVKFDKVRLFHFFSKERNNIKRFIYTNNQLHVHMLTEFYRKSFPLEKPSEKIVKEMVEGDDFLFLMTLNHLGKLSFNLDGVYLSSFPSQHITSGFEGQREYFTEALEGFKEAVKDKKALCLGRRDIAPESHNNRIICGFITLKEGETTFKQRTDKESGKEKTEKREHVLFFQFDQHYHRFHDSGGLFNFPNEKEFFKGLTEHFQRSDAYKQGEWHITFLSMPKESKDLKG